MGKTETCVGDGSLKALGIVTFLTKVLDPLRLTRVYDEYSLLRCKNGFRGNTRFFLEETNIDTEFRNR